jgi:hypothetical protein
MIRIKNLQSFIFLGDEVQAQSLARELLAGGVQPLRLVKEAIIPAVEQSAAELEAGNLHPPELFALSNALSAILQQIAHHTRPRSLALQFKLGRVRSDAFDLWRSAMRAAFEEAGFHTEETSELNRCEMTAICSLAAPALQLMRTPGQLQVHGSFGSCELIRNRTPVDSTDQVSI